MHVTVVDRESTPEAARPLRDRVEAEGALSATSATTVKGEVVAWACAQEREGHVVAAAVALRAPSTWVVVKVAGSPLAAMAIARSLVHRSASKLTPGELVSAQLGDLPDVPFEIAAPQYAIVEASSLGVSPPEARLAIGASWAAMALDPEARHAAVLARAKDGVTRDVLTPIEGAFVGLARALRKAKEPLLSSAAWVLDAQIPIHTPQARDLLRELALTEGLTDDRREVLGALVDAVNGATIDAADAEAEEADGRGRVALARVRLPRVKKGEPGRIVTAYFYAAQYHDDVRLDRRHPESAMPDAEVQAGFATLDAVLETHEGTILEAIGSLGGHSLRRGFHPDVSLEVARASFVADGLLPVDLVLDA